PASKLEAQLAHDRVGAQALAKLAAVTQRRAQAAGAAIADAGADHHPVLLELEPIDSEACVRRPDIGCVDRRVVDAEIMHPREARLGNPLAMTALDHTGEAHADSRDQ